MDDPAVLVLLLEQGDRSLSRTTLKTLCSSPTSCLCSFYQAGLNAATRVQLSGEGQLVTVLVSCKSPLTVDIADNDTAPLLTQSPDHHHPAARSPSLSPPLTESQSPPRPTSHRMRERQSWRSPQSLWHQTRCESRQQSSAQGRASSTARARREAPPTVPWLRVSSALWTVCYLPFSRYHLPALNCPSAFIYISVWKYLAALNRMPVWWPRRSFPWRWHSRCRK